MVEPCAEYLVRHRVPDSHSVVLVFVTEILINQGMSKP